MDISGLENNYYLAGNDVWIEVFNFPAVPLRLELECTNLNTGVTYPIFRLYANPDNVFRFNLSQTIRPLQPYPNHVTLNSIQKYSMEFTIVFDSEPSEVTTLERYFIRGGREKNNIDEWYLSDGYKLFISKWVDWTGILLPNFANRIQSDIIVEYVPTPEDTYKMILTSRCNAKIIKFLNSLGGYQFWVFETSEIKPKTKSNGVISQIPRRLRDDVIRNIGTSTTKEITLKTKTPTELQPIILDLIESSEVLMYDPLGNDAKSRWHRLQLASTNDAILNTNDMSYTNEIDYIIPNYVNRDL